ncbi:MAG: MFS transporter, partial [Alphaproteobacteria bacterium]
APTPRRRAGELVIFGTVFFDMFAIGIVAPVFPQLVTSITGLKIAAVAQLFGWFAVVFGTMQFLGSPILGAASDHFGRRPVIILSNLVSGLNFVLMAVAPNITWLFIGRFIAGFATGSMPAANAWIADTVPPERRAAHFGFMAAAMSLGFALGPAVGGLLGAISPRAPFWAGAAFCIINGLYGYFVLTESLPPERRTEFHPKNIIPFGAIYSFAKRYPRLGQMLFVTVLMTLGGFAMQAIGVIYTNGRYGWDTTLNGYMLTAFGVAGMIIQIFLVRPAIKFLGDRKALVAGWCCQATGLLWFGLATQGKYFWYGIPIACCGSLAGPVWTSYMTKVISPMEQGRLSGVVSSLQSLVTIFAPLMYAYIFAQAIANKHYPGGPGAPFFLASLLLLSAVGLATWITRNRVKESSADVRMNREESALNATPLADAPDLLEANKD